MKISELPRLENIRGDAEIPVAVEGENYNISVEQITASNSSVVRFGTIVNEEYTVIDGYPPETIASATRSVSFNIKSNRFLLGILSNQQLLVYSRWDTYDRFYDADGGIRKECLFIANNGRIYFSDGNTLKSAGLTDEQAKAIAHATPIEVASEEEMEQRIAAGEYEDGQLYFLAES